MLELTTELHALTDSIFEDEEVVEGPVQAVEPVQWYFPRGEDLAAWLYMNITMEEYALYDYGLWFVNLEITFDDGFVLAGLAPF